MSARLLYSLMTSDESVRQDPHLYLASPVALALFGVVTASTDLLWVHDSMMVRFTGIGSFFAIARTIANIGVALGISRLRESGQGGNFLRPVDMGLWANVVNVSMLAGCILMAGAVVASQMFYFGFPLTASPWVISRLNQAALFCSFACAVTTSADAVGKELEELVDVDCDAADFTERIHCPIVEFMGKNRRSLSKLGLPLALMASASAYDFMSYQLVTLENGCHWTGRHGVSRLCVWEDRLVTRLYLLHAVVHMAGVLLACGAAPLRISGAVATAQRKLTKLRSQRPHLHAQIETVEAVMAQENDGQGVGVSIEGALLLNKSLVQKCFVTMVGAAALLLSFTNKLLGIREGPQ
ncbi:unnamed protein product [Prorocentrum cordatum]|uniref:Solute carrier family 40 protein n=2 Tax=Prorocentrum cordatum TaxID=2364126 RepID=A0ABN9V9S7_9DINO|nr:unnamed protein product [Polarella glacialis]